ncbi:MAG: Rsd/AlgQ family anti-sigma factor [Gammaproteobacteria bacterium]|nr:Rsd/AlgQ family anti-sigma factor [Gammaproteobacteria bacterium]
MNDKSRSQRPRTAHLIEALLEERKEMLVLLWEMTRLEPFRLNETLRETLDRFLGVVVDYIAAGHFGLYQRIAEGTERRHAIVALARESYPRISATTDIVIEFSEKYEAADGATIEASLEQDLSTLAEEMAARIELEDRLILAMLGKDFPIPVAAVGAR